MRSPAVRFALFVGFVAAGLFAAHRLGLVELLTDGGLQARIAGLRDHWWTPLALLGLFVVTGCVPLPATAVVLTGGAVYGPVFGSGLNWLGCMLAALAGFLLARALGRDFVVKILGARRSASLEGLVAQHGFWTMVRARMMTPLAVANYGGGLGGMRVAPFLLSSMLGMTLPIAMYSYVGHLLATATGGGDSTRMLRNVSLAVLAMLAMSMVGPILRWWRRRRVGDGD